MRPGRLGKRRCISSQFYNRYALLTLTVYAAAHAFDALVRPQVLLHLSLIHILLPLTPLYASYSFTQLIYSTIAEKLRAKPLNNASVSYTHLLVAADSLL